MIRLAAALLCVSTIGPCFAQEPIGLVCTGSIVFDQTGANQIGSSIGPESIYIDPIKQIAIGPLGYDYSIRTVEDSKFYFVRTVFQDEKTNFDIIVEIDRFTGIGHIAKWVQKFPNIIWVSIIKCDASDKKF